MNGSRSRLVLMLIALVIISVAFAMPTQAASTTTATQAPKYVFKYASVTPKGVGPSAIVAKMKEILAANSGGRVEIEEHLAGELGPSESEYISSLIAGNLDMAGTAAAPLFQFNHAIDAIDFPFLLTTWDDIFAFRNSSLWQAKSNALSKTGVKVIAVGTQGLRGLITSRLITKPADFKGLKVRVMDSRVYVKAFESLGAVVSTLPFGEVVTALQTKTIDAHLDNATMMLAAKLYQIAPYYYNMKCSVVSLPIMMSQKIWDKLPKDIQGILTETGKETEDWFKQNDPAAQQKSLDTMPTVGAKVVACSQADWNAMQKTVLTAVLPEFKDQVGVDTLKWAATRSPSVQSILKDLNIR